MFLPVDNGCVRNEKSILDTDARISTASDYVKLACIKIDGM